MELRKAERKDLDEILRIVKQAQAFLREQGVNQWQDGYPNADTILEDIAQGEGYVLTDNKAVVATAVLAFTAEPTYEVIYNGAWRCEGACAVVHRMATDAALRGRGVAKAMLSGLEAVCRAAGTVESIRVDTHLQNRPMQALLTGAGYVRCGEIVLGDGVSRREAFEKLLGE